MAGAEIGLAITTEVLFAVAKHCKDACSAAKRYPDAAARIRLRLTYLLSRVPEWTDRLNSPKTITDDDNDDGCRHLAKNLYDSLTDLTLCVQAMGSSNDGSWRKKIQLFLDGKNLLDKLNEAESKFNQALDDLNHDNTHFVASHIPKIYEQLSSVSEIETKLSMMMSLFKQFDQLPAGNVTIPTATMNDIIEATMEEYHTKDEVNSNPTDSNNLTTPTTLSSLLSFDTSDEYITIDHSNVQFDATFTTRLGTGGFAKVYKGIFNNNDVAVKVIDIYRNFDRHDEMSRVFYQAECNRVRDEAIIMKHCSIHSNIVDVYGYCPPHSFGSEPLIIMELMYASLNKILHQRTDLVLSYNTRLQLMKDVTNAVEFLHLQGIVHQDVKASNILVDENIKTAKLTDFGVAECKGFKTTWTQQHTTALITVVQNSKKHAAGTLAYQAPELVLGQITVASRSAEIYSLGVAIWECLSRTVPHRNEENKIFFLAQNKQKLMMKFPVKDVIGDNMNTIPDECDAFSLLERVSFICTTRDPSSRPTATNVVHYLAGTSDISQSFPLQYLSHWLIDVNDLSLAAEKKDPNEGTTVQPSSPDQGHINSGIYSTTNVENDNDPNEGKTVQPPSTDPEPINSGINSTTTLEDLEGNVHSSMRRKFVIVGLLVVAIIIGVVVYFVVTQNPDPTPSPTTATSAAPTPSLAPFKSASVSCFTTSDELQSSVIAYINKDTSAYKKYGTSIGDWCVDNIEDFSYLFCDNIEPYTFFDTFNDDISRWNTSAAKKLSNMFRNTDAFNGDISKWDVSSVTDMSGMFWGADAFNGNVSLWDVSSVTDMSHMFDNTNVFNGDVSKWNVSSVTDMSYMFAVTNVFNGDLSKWDVSSVTDMLNMFAYASVFNGDISKWDVSSVTDMSNMFWTANEFNQNLCEWGNKLNANTNVFYMFSAASSCPNTNDPNLSDTLTTKGPFCYSC